MAKKPNAKPRGWSCKDCGQSYPANVERYTCTQCGRGTLCDLCYRACAECGAGMCSKCDSYCESCEEFVCSRHIVTPDRLSEALGEGEMCTACYMLAFGDVM